MISIKECTFYTFLNAICNTLRTIFLYHITANSRSNVVMYRRKESLGIPIYFLIIF